MFATRCGKTVLIGIDDYGTTLFSAAASVFEDFTKIV